MGCSQFSRSQIIHTIQSKAKQSQPILSSETSNTLSQTNLISRIPTVKSSSSYQCLKIKLSKQFSVFILDDLTSLDSLSKKLHIVRKYWIVFQALKSNFESHTHSVCVPNYSLKDGLNVLLLVASGKFGSSSVTFCNESPFLLIKTEGEDWLAYKAWNEFISFLEVVKKKGFLKKIQKYIQLFQEFTQSGQGQFYVKKALKIAKQFLKEAEESLDVVSEFSKGKLTLGLKRLIQEASCAGWICPKYVVHFVLKRLE